MMELALLLLTLVGLVSAYPSGADEAACTSDYMPIHNADAQSGPSPFSVIAPKTKYEPSGSVKVTLKGNSDNVILGFLIVALPVGTDFNEPIGSFSAVPGGESELVQQRCEGKALTHTAQFYSDGGSPEIEVQWNAPSYTAGYVKFYVTFVKSKAVFWHKVSSDRIGDGVGITENPLFVSNPVVTSTCGSVKSCFTPCQGSSCTNDFIVSWANGSNSNKLQFELSANQIPFSSYIAIGIAPSKEMADMTVIACTVDDMGTHVSYGYAADKSSGVSPVSSPTSRENDEASYNSANEILSCRFMYDNSLARTNPNLKDLQDANKEYYLFVARGKIIPSLLPEKADKLLKHTYLPIVSPDPIHFFSTASTGSFIWNSGSSIFPLAKAHGCIMILAWVICASIGVMLARYYKPMWQNNTACGQKVWFSYHRALMLACMFLTIIGVIIIFVDIKGYSQLKNLPDKAHPILGLITLICAVLNPILAACRCSPSHKLRPVFNWFHWFFGTVAHVFAIVSIFLGMLLQRVFVPWWLLYVMMAFCLFHIIVEFTLEIQQCCNYDKNRDRQEEYQLMSKGTGNNSGPKHAGRRLKCACLIIYVIVAICLAIVMVAVIAASGSIDLM